MTLGTYVLTVEESDSFQRESRTLNLFNEQREGNSCELFVGLQRQVVSNTVVRLLAPKMVERRVEIPLDERDLSQPGRTHHY